ncbi:hypothetical protein COR50_01295 [Chitinophaga caeni]|uniref:ApeA N-terminal domain-containing protein n=1 Tax=Chitinophaga caeni TaxID=2029983 RepID=A0A291QPX8_9BACT|nr:hypothetical protein [Chitinophaga caeni]ATL45904.1 hypothetical protein COR50_01295 [Chitinophaga caeni]
MNMRKIKYVREEIALIERLVNGTPRYYKIVQNEVDNSAAILKKAFTKGFDAWILTRKLEIKDEVKSKSFTLTRGNNLVIIKDFFVANRSERIRRGLAPLSAIKVNVNEMRGSKEHSSTAFFKTFIPISKDFKWHSIFDDDVIDLDTGKSVHGLLTVKVDNISLDLYSFKHNSKNYLVLEATTEIDLETFDNYCWSTLIAVAFINGQLWQGDQFYFSYQDMDMKVFDTWSYVRRRNSITSIYPAITSNPHSWMKDSDDADQYNDGSLVNIGSTPLSKLCQWVHDKDMHKSIALLIIESKSASLLLMPAGFAIAIEGLATLFELKEGEKVKPISNKARGVEFVNKLLQVLNDYDDDEHFVGKKILRTNIMQNVNRATNRERLLIPFNLLGIEISQDDRMALDYRNDLLHGNVILEPIVRKKYEMNTTELSMRLMTLANAIIMKNIGYNGRILNHVKLQEQSMERVIQEDHFRKI